MRNKLYFEDECYYLSQNERNDRIPVYRGTLNCYIEKWTNGNGNYLDIAYTELDLQAAGGAYYFRKACFERHGFRGYFVVSLTYPPKKFDAITPVEEEVCGSDMRVKTDFDKNIEELKRVNNELKSEIEKSKSEIVPDFRDGWRLKEGEAE